MAQALGLRSSVSVPLRGLGVFGDDNPTNVEVTEGTGFRPLAGIRGIRSNVVMFPSPGTTISFRPLAGIRGIRREQQIRNTADELGFRPLAGIRGIRSRGRNDPHRRRRGFPSPCGD